MVAQHITEPMNHKKFEFAHGFVDGGAGVMCRPLCPPSSRDICFQSMSAFVSTVFP